MGWLLLLIVRRSEVIKRAVDLTYNLLTAGTLGALG